MAVAHKSKAGTKATHKSSCTLFIHIFAGFKRQLSARQQRAVSKMKLKQLLGKDGWDVSWAVRVRNGFCSAWGRAK